MSTFDKSNAARTETVVVGVMLGSRIRIWRDGVPSTWEIEELNESYDLNAALQLGQISTEAFRDSYYRTTAQLDPESMVACFHTHEPFGRYGGKSSHGQFVQLSTPPRRRRTASMENPRYSFEQAVTVGTAFRDGQTLSLLSAAPSPGTDRWLGKTGDRTLFLATLDPYVRDEVGELVFDAVTAWGIDPWDVVFTFVSPHRADLGLADPDELEYFGRFVGCGGCRCGHERVIDTDPRIHRPPRWPPSAYAPTVQKKPGDMIRRPDYTPTSVDNALRLLQILRDTGTLRLTDAAAEIGVAPSTAHRLLSALVYRGFAVQEADHRYRPGPAIGAPAVDSGQDRDFVTLCRPFLEDLCAAVGETVNLMVLVNHQARFLWTVETSAPLRIGDRRGQVLPAEQTAGGLALLASLSADDVDRRFALDAGERATLHDELAAIRRVGFAVNVERTERGVSAMAMAVHDRTGTAIAAVAVAMPSTRYPDHVRDDLVAHIRDTVRTIEAELRSADPLHQ